MAQQSHFLAESRRIQGKTTTLDSIFSQSSKKALIYLALGGAASWGVFVPNLARAGLFDAFLPQATASATAASSYNSQNMPLPSPAKNIDPNPSVGGGDITVAGGALIAQEGPSGTAADIVHRPESSQISVYTVHAGDTLSGIADMFNVSVNTIVWANDIRGGVIREGQELVILPVTGVRHTVGKGDTLATIAKKYKSDLDEIALYNDLSANSSLAVGSVVIIPDAEIESAATPTRTGGGSTASSGGGSPYIRPTSGVLTQGLHGYNGVDIGAPNGTPVYAAAAGKVIIAREGGWNGGYGSYVVIQHSKSQTLYAHLSSVSVSAGQTVVQGARIGAVGNTGKVYGATGNHLHFEVRGAINPFAR